MGYIAISFIKCPDNARSMVLIHSDRISNEFSRSICLSVTMLCVFLRSVDGLGLGNAVLKRVHLQFSLVVARVCEPMKAISMSDTQVLTDSGSLLTKRLPWQ